ncbi:MAG: hypothetical protein LBT35_03610 [Tannerella sp.]|nr:hypothetical protein [Tannerella sp.]
MYKVQYLLIVQSTISKYNNIYDYPSNDLIVARMGLIFITAGRDLWQFIALTSV